MSWILRLNRVGIPLTIVLVFGAAVSAGHYCPTSNFVLSASRKPCAVRFRKPSATFTFPEKLLG